MWTMMHFGAPANVLAWISVDYVDVFKGIAPLWEAFGLFRRRGINHDLFTADSPGRRANL